MKKITLIITVFLFGYPLHRTNSSSTIHIPCENSATLIDSLPEVIIYHVISSQYNKPTQNFLISMCFQNKPGFLSIEECIKTTYNKAKEAFQKKRETINLAIIEDEQLADTPDKPQLKILKKLEKSISKTLNISQKLAFCKDLDFTSNPYALFLTSKHFHSMCPPFFSSYYLSSHCLKALISFHGYQYMDFCTLRLLFDNTETSQEIFNRIIHKKTLFIKTLQILNHKKSDATFVSHVMQLYNNLSTTKSINQYNTLLQNSSTFRFLVQYIYPHDIPILFRDQKSSDKTSSLIELLLANINQYPHIINRSSDPSNIKNILHKLIAVVVNLYDRHTTSDNQQLPNQTAISQLFKNHKLANLLLKLNTADFNTLLSPKLQSYTDLIFDILATMVDASCYNEMLQFFKNKNEILLWGTPCLETCEKNNFDTIMKLFSELKAKFTKKGIEALFYVLKDSEYNNQTVETLLTLTTINSYSTDSLNELFEHYSLSKNREAMISFIKKYVDKLSEFRMLMILSKNYNHCARLLKFKEEYIIDSNLFCFLEINSDAIIIIVQKLLDIFKEKTNDIYTKQLNDVLKKSDFNRESLLTMNSIKEVNEFLTIETDEYKYPILYLFRRTLFKIKYKLYSLMKLINKYINTHINQSNQMYPS